MIVIFALPLSCRKLRNGIQVGYELDVVHLLKEDGIQIDLQDVVEKKTPLHYAAQEGHDHIVKLLIEAGAHVNLQDR